MIALLSVGLVLAVEPYANPANPRAPAYVKAEDAALQTTFAVEKFPKVLVAGRWADQGIAATDRVYIPAGVTVLIDDETAACEAIRIDGTLRFSRERNTRLVATTVVGPLCSSTLDAGTQADPITAKCEVVFRAKAVDINEDPREFGTGYVGHRTLVWGIEKQGQAEFVNAVAGAGSVSFTAPPQGWQVGDTIVLAGPQGFEQDEKRIITGISGSTVSFAEPLKYNHSMPDPKVGLPFAINLARNIVFRSENAGYGNTPLAGIRNGQATPVDPVVKQMGHFMVMGCGVGNSEIGYAEFRNLGRTDKRTQLSVVKFLNGQRVGEFNGRVHGLNTIGRYSLHFHHGGRQGTPALVKGCAVYGSPGWGYTNHSSNVRFSDCVGYDCIGAIFALAEIGDEVGLTENCAALGARGGYAGLDGSSDDKDLDQDNGTMGAGFWLQGNRTRIRNVRAANCVGGFVTWTKEGVQTYTLPAQPGPVIEGPGSIDPADLTPEDEYLRPFADPVTGMISVGRTAADVDQLQVFATKGDVTISINTPARFGIFKNVKAGGVAIPYADTQRFVDCYFSAGPRMAPPYIHQSRFNFCSHTVEYVNSTVFNFGEWINTVPMGINVFRDCTSNSRVSIAGNYWSNICNIYYHPMENHFENSVTPVAWTGESGLVMNRVVVGDKQLYSTLSDADRIPYPTATASTPAHLVGLTNRQMLEQYGQCVNGDVTPPEAVFDAKYGHKVGPISKRLAVVLRQSYQSLGWNAPSGTIAKLPIEVYPLKQHKPTIVNVEHPVKPGWQPVFFDYDGLRYSVNVFGAGSTPPPDPPVPPPLVVTTIEVTPANLTLEAGKTAQLSAVVKDQFGAVMPGKVVQWSSSNASVAAVSPSGVVTAIGAGNATVVASCESKQAAANVTVSSPPQPTPKTVKKVTVEFSDGSKVELP